MPGNIPDPRDHPHWPAYFYPSETDPAHPEDFGVKFEHWEDVPEGWSCNWLDHGENLNREPPPPPPVGLTRNELKDELAKRDIAFLPTAAKAELQRLLDEAQEAERLENSV